MNESSPLFFEKQSYSNWVILLLTILWLLMILAPLYQLEESRVLIIVSAIYLPIVFFLWMHQLTTYVYSDHIQVKIWPVNKTILFHEISEWYIREYSPIKEYGGWGIRTTSGRKRIAYNMRGNIGLQIILKNDKRILIGTQRPEELEKTLKDNIKLH